MAKNLKPKILAHEIKKMEHAMVEIQTLAFLVCLPTLKTTCCKAIKLLLKSIEGLTFFNCLNQGCATTD